MRKVLIIDDDTSIMETITMVLENYFKVLTSTNCKQGMEIAIKDNPDLILLDLNMSDLNGFEMIQLLKQNVKTFNIPIILCTASNGIENKVKGIELGADDYVTKPFNNEDLVARIQARMRKPNIDLTKNLVYGNLKLNSDLHTLSINEKSIKITKIEFELLQYLLHNQNKVVNRDMFLGSVWSNVTVTSRTIDTHILNLRKKLKDFTGKITTVYGIGYILNSIR